MTHAPGTRRSWTVALKIFLVGVLVLDGNPSVHGGDISAEGLYRRFRTAVWDAETNDWFESHGFSAWINVSMPYFNLSSQFRQTRPSAEYYSSMRHTTYQLGNQTPYTVTMGPAKLQFQGAIVRMTEGENSVGGSCSGLFNWIHAYSGWTTRVDRPLDTDPENANPQYEQGWLKGFLTRQVVELQTGSADICGRSTGDYVYRYRYHDPSGAVVQFYQRPVETASTSRWTIGECNSRTEIPGAEPNFYWSSEGNMSLDASDKCKPVIRRADGSIEEFHQATTDAPGSLVGGSVARWFTAPCTGAQLQADLRAVDRNGIVTTFREGPTWQSVIDPSNRTTMLTFDATDPVTGFRRLRTVDLPSIGNAPPLRYTINWKSPMAIFFKDIWPDVQCRTGGLLQAECGVESDGILRPSVIELVDNIVIPDGRRYTFTYGPWGNLTDVAEPDGTVRHYDYGSPPAQMAYANAVVPLAARLDRTITCGALWTGETPKMMARGLVKETVYPGVGGNDVQETSFNYESVRLPDPACVFDEVGAASSGPDGCAQVWKVITQDDGSVRKIGSVARSAPFFIGRPPFDSDNPMVRLDPHGWSIGEELYSPSPQRLLFASYTGDKNSGSLYFDFDVAKGIRLSSKPMVNVRLRKEVLVTDGVTRTSNLFYDDTVDIDPSPLVTVLRNTESVTSKCVFAGPVGGNGCSPSGAQGLARTDSTYTKYFDGTFKSRLLLGLVQSTSIFAPIVGGSGFSTIPLTESSYAYDEFAVRSSGLPPSVLDTSVGLGAGAPRGNVTTTRQRVDASKMVTAQNHYFDTGAIDFSTDARGYPTTYQPTFSFCSPGSTVPFSAKNALGHTVTTISDCISGAPLKMVDANGRETYSQYDYLGRLVETAGPDDALTALPTTGAQPFVRLIGAPTLPGTVPGNGGTGPTAWREYRSAGIVGQQRVVTHLKDGSTSGLYTKTFTDGLGRTIQTRSKAQDPTSTNGILEVVKTTQYDGMGRAGSQLVRCFGAPADSAASCTSLATTMSYDALGRPTSVQAPGGDPPVTTVYSGLGSTLLAATRNPRGKLTKTVTDLLGRTTEVSRESPLCAGGFCTTSMSYDAAGRMTSIKDPAGNEVSITPDGLGRKITMSDPDMGFWSYEYDDNGNLKKQTDAKGQVITMEYDAINRITLKDLPPAGLSSEDVTYSYDGTGPLPPDPGGSSNRQVVLSWPATTGATGYRVKRSLSSGGPYGFIGNVTTPGYTDPGLTSGVTYFYVVSAVNSGGESANSQQASVTP